MEVRVLPHLLIHVNQVTVVVGLITIQKCNFVRMVRIQMHLVVVIMTMVVVRGYQVIILRPKLA
jgi:hypothetical protein